MPIQLHSSAPVFFVADIASTMRWYQAALGFDADPFPETTPR